MPHIGFTGMRGVGMPPCPKCNAVANEPCRSPSGRICANHAVRERAAMFAKRSYCYERSE